MNRRSLSILVVEDHPTIARQIVEFLDGLGWQTDHAATGTMAIKLATQHTYDVILLDLNLPDIDGLIVCRAIKEQATRNMPVLMLTARDAFEDKARGFNGGADDYLTKPFDLRELALRCEALARRATLHVEPELTVGPLTLQLHERRTCIDGAPVAFTHTGFRILSLLCRTHPQAVTRSAMLHELWGHNPPNSDALKSHLYALRKQLELAGAPDLVMTIPQLGFRLNLTTGGDV